MKKWITVIVAIVLLGQVVSLITGRTLVVPITKMAQCETCQQDLKKNDNINLFADLDFDNGNWKAYLVLSSDDFEYLNSSVHKASCLETTDKQVLKAMQSNWKFRYTEGEISSVGSTILIFKDNKLMFKSGIVLDNYREGLQCQNYGWLQPLNPNALSNSCKMFKRVYWPIVFV